MQDSQKKWMIYGASGYTGELIAREAVLQGLCPILAGRTRNKVESLAHELGLDSKIFSLDSSEEVAKNLAGVVTVLHCAGPFSHTSSIMLDACLQTRTNYLDITGEIDVFETIFSRHPVFLERGISVIPGVGFDVVPTDCIAALLKQKQPDALEFMLAIQVDTRASAGTMLSLMESLGKQKIRKNGKLILDPEQLGGKLIDFGKGRPVWGTRVGWGDVSTAFHSTAIPNISVYLVMGKLTPKLLKIMTLLQSFPLAEDALSRLVKKFARGPDEHQRANIKTRIYGVVKNASGGKSEIFAVLNESYDFTIHSSLAAVKKVLEGKIAPGAWTPSMAFGAGFLKEISKVQVTLTEKR